MAAKLDELDEFIRAAAARGANFAQISAALENAGWDAGRIGKALSRYHETDLGVPVPKPQPFVSARLFFMHCFYFVLLYTVTYNLISIFYTFLDYHLPDGLGRFNQGFYWSPSPADAIQDNMAALIVGTPLLWVVHRAIDKAQTRAGQTIPRIRLMLAYFTLFVGACFLLTEAIMFVYYLLRGELGLRFLIKVLIMTVAILGVWLWHRSELSRDEGGA